MLSPGKQYLQVPKDHTENLDFRRWLLLRCKDNPREQQIQIETCRQDFLYWLASYGWQYNPKSRSAKYGPFLTWPFQEDAARDLLDSIETQTPRRWQKSREMGASWLALYILTWHAIFFEGARWSVISRKEEAVDDPADSDSLFWKIECFLERMPDWLVGGCHRQKLAFEFHRSGGQIIGAANTKDAFVGGRATGMILDEFGQFRNGEEIYSRTADVADCRWFVGTHANTQSFFYDLCFDQKYSWMREICTHWSLHPEKRKGLYRYDPAKNKIERLDADYEYPDDFLFNMSGDPQGGPCPGLRSPWYDQQCRERPSRAVKMDLDIDPRGASRQFFDVFVMNNLKNRYACDPVWTGDLDYDHDTGAPSAFVENPEGLVKLWTKPLSLRPPVVVPGEYGGGLDVAAGTGATPSCLSIMNEIGEKVLSYSNAYIFSNEFGVLAVALARIFCNKEGDGARLAWECQGSGALKRMVVEILKYRRVYWRQNFSKLGEPRVADEPGVNVQDKRTKLRIFEDYRDGLYKGKCLNRDWTALDETLNFEYTPDGVDYKPRGAAEDPSAQRVHHGDPVVADVLAWMMVAKVQTLAKDKEKAEDDWIDPRTLEGRMKLAEMQDDEGELVWL